MKFKPKKNNKTSLADKIADALTIKPKADIEDDQVFGTKPQTVSRVDFSSSDSEEDAVISDFRKRNINLLSDISKKYEGNVVPRKDVEENDSDDSYKNSSSEEESELPANKLLSLLDDNGSSGSENQVQNATKVKPTDSKDSASDAESDSRKDVEENGSYDSYENSYYEKESKHPANKLLSLLDNNMSSGSENEVKNATKVKTDSENSGSDAESDDYSITKFQKQINSDSESEEGKDVESDEDGEGGNADEGYDISQMEEPMKEEFEHVKKQNVSEEAKKGQCVRNQLLLWEGLLEMRIHLQRCMNTANQMPMSDTFETLKANNEFSEQCNTTRNNVVNVLDKFLTLQSLLLKNFPETKSIQTKSQSKRTADQPEEKKEESDEEIPSDTDNEEIPSDTEDEDSPKKEEKPTKQTSTTQQKKRKLEEYETDISSSHKAFKSFRDTTIQKWNDKTRLATAASIKNAPANTILQQISYILSDKEKLVKRTQLKRTEYDIVGYTNPTTENGTADENTDTTLGTRQRKDDDEYIPEIFDDSDFYHQLLRELIECKSADISDPVQLSRQWIALQQMRSKMKRKVDTKATKGRKIKYVVHNQLVNYMGPEQSLTWNDESTNELYSSLFGRMFEQNNIGLNANLENGLKIRQ